MTECLCKKCREDIIKRSVAASSVSDFLVNRFNGGWGAALSWFFGVLGVFIFVMSLVVDFLPWWLVNLFVLITGYSLGEAAERSWLVYRASNMKKKCLKELEALKESR